MNRKKILFYTENYESGGSVRYLLDLCTLASQTDNQIVAYSNFMALTPREKEWFDNIDIKIKNLSICSWGELRARFKLRQNLFIKIIARLIYLPLSPLSWLYQYILFTITLIKEKPDLVIAANGGYPAGGSVLRFALCSFFQSTPVFISIVAPPSIQVADKFRMHFWNRVIPKVTKKIIVNSTDIQEKLAKLGFNQNQLVIFYNGILGAVDYRARNNEKIKILFFSRLEKSKGANVLLDAYEKLAPELKDQIEIHFYGSGSMSQVITEFATKNTGKIYMHGFREGNSEEIFLEADIYTLPSLSEGLPYTILEAMRTGCCILSTNVGGIPEMIESTKEGLLVQPNDLPEFISSLEILIKDKSYREKLGQAAKKKFDIKFEQGSIFNQHANLFKLK